MSRPEKAAPTSSKAAASLRTDDFDYRLPERSIAQEPLARGASRLLVVPSRGHCRDALFGDLPTLLRSGDRLVVNDAKVTPARLVGRRVDSKGPGGRLELLVVEIIGSDVGWAMIRPGRRCRPGTRFVIEAPENAAENCAECADELAGEVEAREQNLFRVRFSMSLERALSNFGRLALPPYIRRPDGPSDRLDYQTIFAAAPGAIAAPTAGLHFTAELLEELDKREIGLSKITLHVGLGTFLPVNAASPTEHKMHSERFVVSEQAAEEVRATRSAGGRVVAVGTTAVRTLEAAAQENGSVTPGNGSTDLFILPGFEFQVVDLLITNFHLPRSTLLMLVAAFCGRRRALAAYGRAVDSGYRFYSYGDAMFAEGSR